MSGEAGLYEPGDLMWQVNREAALLLSGPRALLMQVAHPLVAAGVAQHSQFQSDPLSRLRGTLDAMLGMIFGSRDEAEGYAQRVNSIHERVHGQLASGTDCFAPGTPYSALDPELLFWVQATLIDSALTAYDCFVKPLSQEDKARLYEESKRMAPLLKLPLATLPEDYPAFRETVDGMVAGNQLEITPEARAIADAVLHPGLLHLPRPVWQLASILPLGLLPEKLRTRYGFRWGGPERLAWRAARQTVRALRPVLPERATLMPRARRAARERAALSTHEGLASTRAGRFR